jgi:hypothetical protein
MSMPEDDFISHAARVAEYVPHSLSEADTRAWLVDPMLRILGYTSYADVHREVYVPETKEFLDYELYVEGKPWAIVEAKAVQHSITDQHAAQCVQYAAIRGVRWCLITNGAAWHVYCGSAPGPLAEKRVAVVTPGGSEAATARAWEVLSLFAQQASDREARLTALLARRVITDELRRADSAAIRALSVAVKQRFGTSVPGATLVGILAPLLAAGTAAPTPFKTDGVGHAVAAQLPASLAAATITPPGSEPAKNQPLLALLNSGMLPEGARIEYRVRGITFTARVISGAKIDVDGNPIGNPFASLSGAARCINGGVSVNGWVAWTFDGKPLKTLWDQLQGRQ